MIKDKIWDFTSNFILPICAMTLIIQFTVLASIKLFKWILIALGVE